MKPSETFAVQSERKHDKADEYLILGQTGVSRIPKSRQSVSMFDSLRSNGMVVLCSSVQLQQRKILMSERGCNECQDKFYAMVISVNANSGATLENVKRVNAIQIYRRCLGIFLLDDTLSSQLEIS